MGFVQDPNRLRPCKGTCGRMTRNTKMPLAQFPDTVTRCNADYCTACQKAIEIANGTYVAPKSEAVPDAVKEKIAAERLAAAEKARVTLLEQRARRARASVRRASMGQSMVRI